MSKKPTYEGLEQRVKELEKEAVGRKQAEDALRLFSHSVDSLIDGIAMSNTENRIIYVNETFARMFGYSREELVGKEIAFIYPENQITKLEEALKATMESGWIGELIGKKKDGELFPIAVSSSRVVDDEGNVIAHMASHRDITERKRAEEELRKSKEFAEDLIFSMQDGFSVLNSKTEHINVNDSFCNMTGFSRDELIGVGVPHPYWPPEEYENIQKSFKKTLQGDFEDFELRFMRKNGERFPVIVSPSWLKDRKGEVINYYATIKDITDRKRTETALRESEAQKKAILDASIDRIRLVDKDMKITWANKTTTRELNVAPEDLIGQFCYEALTGKDIPCPECPTKKALETGNIEHAIIHQPKLKVIKGETYWDTYAVPIKSESGDIVNFIQISRNITEQVRTGEALRESEEKYRSLVESTEDSIYLLDRNCTYLFINKKHLSRLGLAAEKAVGRTYAEFHSEDDIKELVGKVEKVFETGESLSYEYRSQRDGGYYIRTLSPVKESDGRTTSVTVVSKDISERKQAEDQLKRSNEELLKEHNQRKILSKRLIELLEKDRRQIAMELHDHIGQTLASLKMNLEMIHGKLKPGHTELGAQITVAQEKTIHAIKDVKNVSHGLRPAMIDALGVVSSLRELFNEIQQQTDIDIHFFSRGIPKRFEEGKELAIYRIAQEALGNIIRHAQAKNVFVNLVKKDEKLSLSVEDDGVGFDQDKVMKPSKKKGPLGLLIMRERAVQFDGELTIESQLGKGTHLLVEIPL